jgi:hypothetical protein
MAAEIGDRDVFWMIWGGLPCQRVGRVTNVLLSDDRRALDICKK